jgi:hypothetical protein
MRSSAAFLLLAAVLAAPSAAAEPPVSAPLSLGDDGATYRDPPVTERRSPAMVATGAALWFAGALAAVPGAGVLFAQALGTCQVFPDEASPDRRSPFRTRSMTRAASGGGELVGTAQQAFSIPCNQEGPIPLGAGLLSAGVLLGGIGIPFFVIGNQRVPARPRGDAAWVPALQIGAGTADLRWNF